MRNLFPGSSSICRGLIRHPWQISRQDQPASVHRHSVRWNVLHFFIRVCCWRCWHSGLWLWLYLLVCMFAQCESAFHCWPAQPGLQISITCLQFRLKTLNYQWSSASLLVCIAGQEDRYEYVHAGATSPSSNQCDGTMAFRLGKCHRHPAKDLHGDNDGIAVIFSSDRSSYSAGIYLAAMFFYISNQSSTSITLTVTQDHFYGTNITQDQYKWFEIIDICIIHYTNDT